MKKPPALPARMVFDSVVTILALEHKNPTRKDDPRVPDARQVWVRALRESRILLSPLVVLEFLGGGKRGKPFPLVSGIEHVGITYQMAEAMAQWASPAAIKKVVKESAKTTRDVVKYDALIVAAAKFYGADVIVTYDADITKLGKLAKVKVCTPGDLLKGTTRPLFPDHP